MNKIHETHRLRFIPHSPKSMLALIEGKIETDAEFTDRFGVPPAEGMRAFLAYGEECSPAWIAKLRVATAPDPWEFGYAVVHRESGLMIGTAGFKGPPDAEGIVEIAYGIVPAFEGHGYATETARTLVAFAARDGRVQRVRAHTLPEENASTRVLAKSDFLHVGEVMDPEDGLVWRWERDKLRGE